MEKKKILKNVLKIILLIIVLLIVIIAIHTVRNYSIITDLQEKISKYKTTTNYHIKSISDQGNGTIITMNYYKKDNKQVVFLERELEEKNIKISMYDNGKRTDKFTETKETKIAELNTGTTIIPVNITNQVETESKWQTFISSITAKVKKSEFNGKECYIINNFFSENSLNGLYENAVYVEKDTGLLIKSVVDSNKSEREYEFNKVEDTIFTEPDISQYTLK